MRRESCVICGRSSTTGWTCGNSYCQEADYHQNLARNARKGSKSAAAAWSVANEKTEMAVQMHGRRNRN